MAQYFLKTIKRKDFVKGVPSSFLFDFDNLNILAESIKIKVTKQNNNLFIEPFFHSPGSVPLLTNFTIEQIVYWDEEQQEEVKTLYCCFNWDTLLNTNTYFLYQNSENISTNFKLNTRIDFTDYEDGEYIFKIQAIKHNAYIKNENNKKYSYMKIDIPVMLKYKYYFYYYIQNQNEDNFDLKILQPYVLDEYAAEAIENNISFEDLSSHLFTGSAVSRTIYEGVYLQNYNECYYYDETDLSESGYPPAYFIFTLDEKTGENDISPIIEKIDIFIEKIDEIGGED